MYNEIAANKRKTVLLMIFFVVLVAGLGWLASQMLGSQYVTVYVLIGSLAYVLISYFAASRTALAMNGAKPIAKRDNPRLYRIVENLSITEGIPTPKIYIINDPAPNAFATGRNPQNATVAATTGLLDMMTDSELQGVMAHELGHIRNYDVRVSIIAFALVAVVGLLSDIMLRLAWFSDDDDNGTAGLILMALGILGAILAPIVAVLIQMAISRKREFLADATGALTTRYPDALASALTKIGQHGSVMKKQNPSTAHFFFANPLKKSSISSMFSTHPSVTDRVKRLQSMGEKA